jgi:hypothetical protein
MHKWKITTKKRSPDEEVIDAYNMIYHSPLGSAHYKAIKALFIANCCNT